MFLYEQLGLKVTQIGSLPFESIDEAIAYSFRCLDVMVPFLPEATKLGDNMLNYIKNPGQNLCLERFKEEISKRKCEVVKIQCIGPVALMQAKYEENDAQERIIKHIQAMMRELEVKEVILFLDEPGLGQTGIDYETQWNLIFGYVRDEFRNCNIVRGVHCCGFMQWDNLLRSDALDIISFDASQFNIKLYYKERPEGKKIAWGINNKRDIRDWRPGDLITPTCGLGGEDHAPDYAYKQLEMLLDIARSLG
jgi:hypothetical protein